MYRIIVFFLFVVILGSAGLFYFGTVYYEKSGSPQKSFDFNSAAEGFSKSFAAGRGLVSANIFQYRQVDVSGLYRLSKEEVLSALDIQQYPWVWQRLPNQLDNALSLMGWVDQVEVKTKPFPLRLDIRIVEEEPWLVIEHQGHSWLLARSGRLIVPLASITDVDRIVEVAELPRLEGLDSNSEVPNYLTSPNAKMRHAVKTIRWLEMVASLPFEVESYRIESDGSLSIHPVQRKKFPTVLLNINNFQAAELSLLRLNAVLDDLRERGEEADSIDLRFENQAVIN